MSAAFLLLQQVQRERDRAEAARRAEAEQKAAKR